MNKPCLIAKYDHDTDWVIATWDVREMTKDFGHIWFHHTNGLATHPYNGSPKGDWGEHWFYSFRAPEI